MENSWKSGQRELSGAVRDIPRLFLPGNEASSLRQYRAGAVAPISELRRVQEPLKTLRWGVRQRS